MALLTLTVFGAAFAMLPNIIALLTFGSVVFLAVFGATNLLAFRVTTGWRSRATSGIAALACFAALIVLLIRLASTDLSTLLLIGLCVAAVSALRFVFVVSTRRRPGRDQTSPAAELR